MKWVKFDPDAWLSGTRELTHEEKGIYIDVIALLYARNGNLPNDDKIVARMLQCNPRTWRKIKPKLVAKNKIRLFGSNWTANRVEFELNWSRIHAEFQSNKSKRREESTVEENHARANNHNHNHNKERKEHIRAVGAKNAPRPPRDEVFEKFWESYPKREGANPKVPARKAFEVAIRQGTEAQSIIVAAKAYATDPTTKPGTPYVAQAVTWLHQRRWQDYADKAAEYARIEALKADEAAEQERRKIYWLNRLAQEGTGNAKASEKG